MTQVSTEKCPCLDTENADPLDWRYLGGCYCINPTNKELCVNGSFTPHFYLDIKYCPLCGRKL